VRAGQRLGRRPEGERDHGQRRGEGEHGAEMTRGAVNGGAWVQGA
jgi:hypothetical protein